MIADLKPYAEYKESGLPWLGKVPGHWSVRRIKTVLRETDHRSADGAETLLSLTRVRGLIPHRTMTDKLHSAKSLVGYKCYRAGQLVMNRMQAWSGMFGAAKIDGLVSPDYAVFEVLSGHAVEFVLERIKSPDLVGQFALESKGIGSGFNRLYTDRFGPIRISLPPPDEQAAIVRFLDWASVQLERAIRAKRKVIALLNEQKQAIIHRAVTRGLDPSVPLKPSGIPWLGDIPARWGQQALWTLSNLRTERNPGYLPLLSVFLDRGVIRYEEGGGQVHAPSLDLSNYQVVRSGDFVLNNQQAWRGSVGVSRHDGIISPAYIVLALSKCLEPNFANYLMRSRAMVDQFIVASKGVGDIQRQISWPFLRMVQLPLPPAREQRAIAEHLEAATAGLMHSISRLEREIDLLREYRTRLVADVVTGKLDVREAAARLPEESAVEPSDDDAELDDEAAAADEEAVA